MIDPVVLLQTYFDRQKVESTATGQSILTVLESESREVDVEKATRNVARTLPVAATMALGLARGGIDSGEIEDAVDRISEQAVIGSILDGSH